MMRRLIYFSILLLCYSCHPEPVDLGMATPYFPSAKELRKGFVYKYYSHRTPKNMSHEKTTDILYRSFQFLDPDILEMNTYNAALEMSWYYKYQVKDDQFRIMDSYWQNRGDTIYPKTRKNIHVDWANQKVEAVEYEFYDKTYDSNSYTNSFQLSNHDTIVDGKEFKFITRLESNTFIDASGDTTINRWNILQKYEKGNGLISQIATHEKHTTISELIEKMSLSEFQKRANHQKQRIGFIDPAKTIDDHSGFKLCGNEVAIIDYYACMKRGELRGGKGSWWRVLKLKLNKKKLQKESGYLSYRFVINCKGETGRFITESADLDYNEKKFNQETVDHLYDIVSREFDWQYCHSNQYNFDSYAFLTFKLKDGEIIDLLP